MMPRALTVYFERSIIWARKRFFMGDFVRMSLETLEQAIDEAIVDIDPNRKIGIFGIGDAANVVHRRLVMKGCADVVFIATNPQKDSHRGYPLIDFNGEDIFYVDIIFASSLSNALRQTELLLERGYAGEIIKMKNLSHLSTIISNDFSNCKKIKKIENNKAGKPAFIIGNGPSLNETDPRQINGNFVKFAGNGIVNLPGFVPDYYFALDPNAIKMWHEKIASLPSEKFFPAHLKNLIHSKHKNMINRNNVFFPVCYQREGEFDINSWEQFGFESGQTVVCPMIQFAMLMKCNPIYLIGVDLSYGSGKNYFSDSYHAAGVPGYRASETSRYNQKMGQGIERLAQACRAAGIRIYNCAPTRNLPFLEEVAFEAVLAQ